MTLRIKKQATKWEKILENHVSDTRLVSKMKNILKYNKSKQLKWRKYLTGHFTKEDVQTTNMNMKRCST